ncbi:MAG: hypothetical protein ABWK05_06195 [Pyrobaculum sp.]
MGLSAEEKRRFLKALDEESKLAGAIGLGEVLKELYRLREESDRRRRRNEHRWRQEEKDDTWHCTWQKFLEDFERRQTGEVEARRRFARAEAALGGCRGVFSKALGS